MKKYSTDGRVCFDHSNHTYTLDGKKKLTSVTSLISKFKNKFDSDYHAERIALREGKTKEEILTQWKEKADLSCLIGTRIHSVIENYILTGNIMLSGLHEKEQVAEQFINDFFESKRLIPVFVEHIVYNDVIAGQIDLICKDSDNNHYIVDFKTNSSIDKYSYGKKLNGVLCSYNDSSYYHYSLQLSIYRELLTELEIKDIYIVHIKDNKYEFIKGENILNKVPLIKITSEIKTYK